MSSSVTNLSWVVLLLDDDHELIPSQPPPSRGSDWLTILLSVAAATMVALVVGIPLTRSLNNQSPETSDTNRIESVRVSALGNHFMMFDRQWDAFEGKYNLSGSLVLTSARNLPQSEMAGDLLRALCGGILTQLSQMPEAPVGRADVFRITVSFPVFEDGQQTEHFFIRSKIFLSTMGLVALQRRL